MMGATVNGGGDQLARGATRVQFRNASGVTEEKYNEATQGFDLKRFLSGESDSDTDSEQAGTAGADAGEVADSVIEGFDDDIPF
jgi:hypothetical protein